MSDHHPDDDIRPTEDLTGGAVAHIGFSNTAMIIAERALMLVPTEAHGRLGPGGLTRAVAELRGMLNEMQARAITADLMNAECTWDDIGAPLKVAPDVALYRYGHLDWGHLADDPQAVWDKLRPTCIAQLHGTCSEDPGKTARNLDERYRRYHDPHEAAPVQQHAVTAGLSAL